MANQQPQPNRAQRKSRYLLNYRRSGDNEFDSIENIQVQPAASEVHPLEEDTEIQDFVEALTQYAEGPIRISPMPDGRPLNNLPSRVIVIFSNDDFTEIREVFYQANDGHQEHLDSDDIRNLIGDIEEWANTVEGEVHEEPQTAGNLTDQARNTVKGFRDQIKQWSKNPLALLLAIAIGFIAIACFCCGPIFLIMIGG